MVGITIAEPEIDGAAAGSAIIEPSVAGPAVGGAAAIPELQEHYASLDRRLTLRSEAAIDPDCLLTFAYEYPGQAAEVVIDTDEFTALCPWTGLPDYGTLTIAYIPGASCIELKSLKYYLLSFRDVGIVQEHAANRILKDLITCCQPAWMKVALDYKIRGGIHTAVSVEYRAGGE